jgi:hypothetical protein
MSEKNYFRRTHFPDKFLRVIPIVREERERICKSCGYYSDKQTCRVNDRFMPATIVTKAARCPIGQWDSNYDN